MEIRMEPKSRALRVDDMPLERLRDRAADVRRILRRARLEASRVGGGHAIDAALDRAERLLPGLMDRTRSVPLLAMRRLSPAVRAGLRVSLSLGEDVPGALEGFSTKDALEALERLDLQESLTREVLRLLASLEADHALVASAC